MIYLLQHLKQQRTKSIQHYYKSMREYVMIFFLFLIASSFSEEIEFQKEESRLLVRADWLRNTSALDQYLPTYRKLMESKEIKALSLSFAYCKDPQYIIKNFFSQKIEVYSLYVNLDSCKIGDKGITQILQLIHPQHIKQLHLLLSSTGTTKEIGKILGEKIVQFQLKALKLSLMMVKIGDQGLTDFFLNPVSSAIEQLSLDLTNCKLGVESFRNFSYFLSNADPNRLTKVQISVRGNKIEANATMDLAKALKRFMNLQTFKFDAYFNNLKSRGVKPISLLVRRLQKLKVLSLNFDLNYIETEGGKLIGQALKELRFLEYLQIGVSTKNFGYNGYNFIIAGMMNMSSLKALSFRCGVNRIGTKAANDFKKLLQKLVHLEYLQLYLIENVMYDEGLSILSSSISKLVKLKTLIFNFSFNEVKGKGLIDLLQMIQGSQLEKVWLGLSNNPLRDSQVILALPHLKAAMSKCPQFELEFLYTQISENLSNKIEQLFEKMKESGRNALLHINSQEQIKRDQQQIEKEDQKQRRQQSQQL